ncbi:hypothetical protein OSCI_1450013 [Kamptonema sp. PCC 6506]|uniref:hypothetical protein n=1 Tax=Kamptonema formosum TaxID=331992 RepID=UPI0001DACA8D|nr:hypothetical protein [Kamptonema formosum]CBN55006.1 hypothetical protein OSCI_1450013 [Kamptonema sp. PCC 6506]
MFWAIVNFVHQKKHLQKYVSRQKDQRRKYRRRSIFGSGQDGEEWVNYLDRYKLEVKRVNAS